MEEVSYNCWALNADLIKLRRYVIIANENLGCFFYIYVFTAQQMSPKLVLYWVGKYTCSWQPSAFQGNQLINNVNVQQSAKK